MDARLRPGDPGFRGMRGGGARAARRARHRLRDHQGELRRLLVGGRRPADRAITTLRAWSDRIESDHALDSLVLTRNLAANRSHFSGLRSSLLAHLAAPPIALGLVSAGPGPAPKLARAGLAWRPRVRLETN